MDNILFSEHVEAFDDHIKYFDRKTEERHIRWMVPIVLFIRRTNLIIILNARFRFALSQFLSWGHIGAESEVVICQASR